LWSNKTNKKLEPLTKSGEANLFHKRTKRKNSTVWNPKVIFHKNPSTRFSIQYNIPHYHIILSLKKFIHDLENFNYLYIFRIIINHTCNKKLGIFLSNLLKFNNESIKDKIRQYYNVTQKQLITLPK
jgi:hypothetical protein